MNTGSKTLIQWENRLQTYLKLGAEDKKGTGRRKQKEVNDGCLEIFNTGERSPVR